jgi:methylenetetrahydrofolate--tRNA-(uracil-5-)-methyltransferase
MNINFGIFPTIQGEITANGKFRKIKGADRKVAYCRRALNDFKQWLGKADD